MRVETIEEAILYLKVHGDQVAADIKARDAWDKAHLVAYNYSMMVEYPARDEYQGLLITRLNEYLGEA